MEEKNPILDFDVSGTEFETVTQQEQQKFIDETIAPKMNDSIAAEYMTRDKSISSPEMSTIDDLVTSHTMGLPQPQTVTAEAIEEAMGPIDKSTGLTQAQYYTEPTGYTSDTLDTRTIGVNTQGDYELSAPRPERPTEYEQVRLSGVDTKSIPASYINVQPFKISLPEYGGKTVTATSVDRRKMAYDIGTQIVGKPVESFVGMTYVGGGTVGREGFISSLSKGIKNLPIDAITLLRSGSGAIGGLASMMLYGADTTAEAFKTFEADWNKNVVSKWKSLASSEPTDSQTFAGKIGYALPNAAASLGLLKLARLAGGAPGLIGASALLNFGDAVDVSIAASNYGISPEAALARGYMAGAINAALDMIGVDTMDRLTFSSLGRDYIRNAQSFTRRTLRNVARESLTEGAQEATSVTFSDDWAHQDFIDNIERIGISAVVGALSSLATIPADKKQQKIAELSASILQNKLSTDAEPLAKSLNEAVNSLVATGFFDRARALDFLVKASDPANRERLYEDIKTALDEEIAKLDPKAVETMNKLPQFLKDEAANSFRTLDARVRALLPNEMEESDKIVITRAMRGIAAVIGFYTGKQLELPNFVLAKPGELHLGKNDLGYYNEDTNTIVINRNVVRGGRKYDSDQVIDPSRFSPISKRHETLLHELGHYLDKQLGRGTNFKEFLPKYFATIAHVYGSKFAIATKQAMVDGDKRMGNVDTTDKTKYFSPENTTEVFAHAIGRIGKDLGLAFGYKGDVAEAITVANLLGRHIVIPEIQSQLNQYANDLRNLVLKNSETLKALAERHGLDQLADSIDAYMAGDKDALDAKDIEDLMRITSSFVADEDLNILSSIFKNTDMRDFMAKGKRELGEAVDRGIAEEKARATKQAKEKKEKNIKGVKPDGTLDIDWEDANSNSEKPKSAFSMDSVIPDAEEEYTKQSKRTYKSGLKARTDAKINGKTFWEDAKELADILRYTEKMPKWFRKFFGGYTSGDLVISSMILGGKKFIQKFDFAHLFNKANSIKFDLMQKFDDRLRQELFKNSYERDVFENACAQDTIIVNPNGIVDPLTKEPIDNARLSPFQAMVVYLHHKNSKTWGKMVNSFFSEQDALDVINQLTPEQKKYADIMQEMLEEYWEPFKQSYSDLGETIDDDPYWPIAEAVHAALGERRPNQMYSRDLSKDYAISLDVDARELFNNYIARVASAQVGLYATVQRVKDLIAYNPSTTTENLDSEGLKLSGQIFDVSRRLRGWAANKFGSEKTFNNFINLLDDFVGNVDKKLVSDSAINTLAQTITTGMLSWRPIQFFKNLTNFATFWGLAENQGQYWANTMWAATHIKEAIQYMMDNVPTVKIRYKGQNIDEQLTSATAGGNSLWFKLEKGKNRNPTYNQFLSNMAAITQALKRAGIQPTLAGDLVANVIGGYGLLKEYEAKYGDKETAVKEFTRQLETRQSSTNQAFKSLAQRQWNRDVRGQLITFTSEQAQKAKGIAMAIAEAQTGERSWGSSIKEVASTLSGVVLFILVSAGVFDLFDDDEENDEEVYNAMTRELIGQVTGANIFASAVVAPIFTGALGMSQTGIGTPLTQWVSKELRALKSDDWEKALIDGAASLAGIAGADQLTNAIESGYGSLTSETDEELEYNLRKIYGETPNRAEKRSGFKKDVE